MNNKKKIYLDGAGNTPLDPKVFAAMKPYMKASFVGNSMSIHPLGVIAGKAVSDARESIARNLFVDPSEVYFTSGSTESNNWVIKSLAFDILFHGSERKRIVCSVTEHGSVLNCCKQVEEWGVPVSYVLFPKQPWSNFNPNEISIPEEFLKVAGETKLLCLMAVNNELGYRNFVKAITKWAKSKGILTLVDCTQLLNYGGDFVEIGRNFPNATYFSFSSHKIYGPTGVGCLIAREGSPLSPLIIGGAQEKGLRGGTMNTAGIVGMAKAVEMIHAEGYQFFYIDLFHYLEDKLQETFPRHSLNWFPDHANIVSLNMSREINTDQLASMLAMHGICVSAGSACDSTHDEMNGDFNPSHVLTEFLHLSEADVRNTIRISFTKYSTKKDIDALISALKEIKDFLSSKKDGGE